MILVNFGKKILNFCTLDLFNFNPIFISFALKYTKRNKIKRIEA